MSGAEGGSAGEHLNNRLTKRSKLATEQPQTKCCNSVFGCLCAVPCMPLC